jgi:hypothetical protein
VLKFSRNNFQFRQVASFVLKKLKFQKKAIFFCIKPNGLQLKEVGDFYHKCLYEAQMFVEPQNCHTKH